MPEPEKVAHYYDNWNDKYKAVYGEIIQAYRPANTAQMLDSIFRSLDLKEDMRLIDAGCGFGGPAAWFAKKLRVHIDAITISEAQVKEAGENIAQQGLEDRVHVKQGDYHLLDRQFYHNNYDGVYFLESLGHCHNLHDVIKGAWTVLKPNGFIYIKDFFFKETNSEAFNARVKNVVERVNENYCYNVLSLMELLKTLRQFGFTIQFIRPPDFMHDIAVRKKFEDDYGIDNYGGAEEFYYSEWLEIKCIKSDY